MTKPKTVEELRAQWEEQTGDTVINSQDEPDIDYMDHLESLVLSMWDDEDLREAVTYVVDLAIENGHYNPPMLDEWLAARKEKGI